MEPSKVPFGAIFRVPGFQANTLDCVKGDDFLGPRNIGCGISPDAPESSNTRVLGKRSLSSTLNSRRSVPPYSPHTRSPGSDFAAFDKGILVNRIEASPSISV
jgi:hypothetical protein